MGYNSTNIYQIWIPNKHKIIETKNVIFDENLFYISKEIDFLQIIKKPMLETTFELIVFKYFLILQKKIQIIK